MNDTTINTPTRIRVQSLTALARDLARPITEVRAAVRRTGVQPVLEVDDRSYYAAADVAAVARDIETDRASGVPGRNVQTASRGLRGVERRG